MPTDSDIWMWVRACAVLEQMPGQFFRPGFAVTEQASWEPPIDIFETPDDLRIYVALPGVDAQDIDVAIEGDTLIVSGFGHVPVRSPTAAIRRLEIPYGRFERHVKLPSGRFELGQPQITKGCLQIILAKRR